jgi:hypothetical protein
MEGTYALKFTNLNTGRTEVKEFERESYRDGFIEQSGDSIEILASADPRYTHEEVAAAIKIALDPELTGLPPMEISDEEGHEFDARLSEVSDDIDTLGSMSDFKIRTTDGRTFRIRVTETFEPGTQI